MLYIILPAFNEENNIKLVLEEIIFVMADSFIRNDCTIVVVDDGSTDRTNAIVESHDSFKSYKENDRFQLSLLSHKLNKGLAESLRTGLLFCLDSGSEGDIVITMDSDNTHTPKLIISLLSEIHKGFDVVIASRFKNGAQTIGIPLHRRLLSFTGSIIFRLLFPIQNIKDFTSGYRAYRLEVLNDAFEAIPNFISESGFSCMVDILLKLRSMHNPLRMTEIPIILRYNLKKGRSKMNIGETIVDTLRLIMKRKVLN